MNERFRNFVNYKIGSYWIYHNDILDTNDTVQVSKYSSYFSPSSESSDADFVDYYENLDLEYKSSFTKSKIYDHVFIDCLFRQVTEFQKDDTAKWTELEMMYSNNKFVNKTIYQELDLLDTCYYLHNYLINGIKYDTILYYFSSTIINYQHKNPEKLEIELFFSLNEGLIQKIYSDSVKTMNWYMIKNYVLK